MTPPNTAPRFDAALCEIAELLADARDLERRGRAPHAEKLYTFAEERAFNSGFLELLRLVWAYVPTPGGLKRGGA